MQLIPAIDLLDGRCVRLVHGDFNAVTWYDEEPARIAARYENEGAEWLHVVDLEASRDGASADSSALFALLQRATQKVQTGGGVRSSADVQLRLDQGASRVVVGSICATETERFVGWLEKLGPEYLVAALDVRIDSQGVPRPRVFGWTEEAELDLWDLLNILVTSGLQHALITDISRDGAMSGPNVELYADILKRYPDLQLQASGGVSRVADLTALAATGASAAIVGKALLEGGFTVGQAVTALAE
jgi:phosphoribosylformimino-5-aminoimidazole carboxamide ribotide isomerase